MREKPKRNRLPKARRHHLDRRAEAIAADPIADGPPDQLLSTKEVAAWLGVSIQFLEIGRHRGYGPRFTRLGPRMIRYRRADVLHWLGTRTHASTAEYVGGRR